MSPKTEHFYEFEDFRLDVDNPCLWRGDQIVTISPKALEMLILLVGKKGEIVSRDELINTVWKDTFVEEGNINYTISLLRKIFENKELIKTIPRRGYRFTPAVKETSGNRIEPKEIPAVPTAVTPQKPRFRWVFASLSVVAVFSLIIFLFFWRVDRTAKASNDSQGEKSEAMQAYLRGKMVLESRNVDNRQERAMDEFQTAVRLDPTLAIAYAGLGEAHATKAASLNDKKSAEEYAKAKRAAEKALDLEPNLAEGYLITGWLKRNFDWDWLGAEVDLRHAIDINPRAAIAHQRLAQTLSVVGKFDESLAEIKTAYQLDPISDTVLGARFPILESRGEYAEGLKEAEDLLRENKASNQAARAYATFLYHTRDLEKVVAICEESISKAPDKTPFAWYSLLAASYQQLGMTDKADNDLRKLETLAQNDSKAEYSLAMNYAELGRIDESVRALEHCYNTREERMVWLKNEPRFANLRTDERFQKLLQMMNLG